MSAIWFGAGVLAGAVLLLVEARREIRADRGSWMGRGWDQGYVAAQHDSGQEPGSWPSESDNPHLEGGTR